MRLSTPEACLFRFDGRQTFSKGEASNDFDAGLNKGSGFLDLDLKKASRFEVEAKDLPTIQFSSAHIIIEGRGVSCADGKCEDKATFYIDGYNSKKPTSEQRDLISRRERAIAFVPKDMPPESPTSAASPCPHRTAMT